MGNDIFNPYSSALQDYFNGKEAELLIRNKNGTIFPYPLEALFQEPSNVSYNNVIFENCSGRVLDVGAGAGRFALALQKKGYSVCAVDISLQGCSIMEKRGIVDVRCIDVWELVDETFDTILLLGQGLGIANSIEKLPRFLTNKGIKGNFLDWLLIDQNTLKSQLKKLEAECEILIEKKENYIARLMK
ncbi:MAG: class I SAM-dependent methyltransferase [Promethearchaeota archaeon]